VQAERVGQGEADGLTQKVKTAWPSLQKAIIGWSWIHVHIGQHTLTYSQHAVLRLQVTSLDSLSFSILQLHGYCGNAQTHLP